MTRLLVNIDVDDLEKAERFYQEALELRVARRLGPRITELTGAACPIYLLAKDSESEPFPGASGPRSYARHWTPIHLDFVVPDIQRAVDRAERAGAICEAPITVHVWGKLALFADPFGHGFCLIEFSERGYDAITTSR